jgi:DNA-binding MarR family transcriptional regulator
VQLYETLSRSASPGYIPAVDDQRFEPSVQQIATWRAFLTAHARVTERLEHELLAERSLPLAWYDVLVQLSEAAEHRLRMHDLAHAVLLSRAGLTRLIDRMVAAGLVERVACAEDRRGTYVAMTEGGMRSLRAAAPIHLAGINEHFAGRFTPAETEQLQGMMERLVRAEG